MAIRQGVRLVLLCVVVAALWVLASDYVFTWLFATAGEPAAAAAINGLLFAGGSALLLWLILRLRAPLPLSRAGTVGRRLTSRPLVVSGTVAAALVMLIGSTVFGLIADAMRQQETARLVAVAETKVSQIEAWLGERLGDISDYINSPFFHEAVPRGGVAPKALAEELAERLAVTVANGAIGALTLRGPDGAVIASAGAEVPVDQAYQQALERALGDGRPALIDFHRSGAGQPPRLGLLGVIRDRHLPARPVIGVLAAEIDPEQALYPILRSWPGTSDSAETLIVRREDGRALFLSPLRHREGSELAFSIEFDRGEVPAVQALTRGNGTYDGRDYRGEPVLSVARAIAGTPWMLVAKIDQVELFAGIRTLALVTTLLVGAALAVIGLFLVILWRQERLHHRVALVHQLETVAAVAPGVLYSFRRHADGRTEVPYLAPAFRELTGIEPDQLQRQGLEPLLALMPEDERREFLASMARVTSDHQLWHHQWPIEHPEKGLRWLEARARRTVQGDGSTLWRGFILDITERRQSELLNRRFGVTLMSIGDGVIAADAEGRVVLLNPVAETLTGWSGDDARGRPLAEVFHIINEYSRAPVDNPVTRVLRDGLVVGLANHTLLVARDGRERPIADSGAPIRDERGRITGVVLVFRDQSEQRAAEQALQMAATALQEREMVLSAIFRQAPDSIVLIDTETLGFVEFNDAACRNLGYSREQFACMTLAQVQALLTPEQTRARVDALKGHDCFEFENRHRTHEGEVREIYVRSRPIELRGRRYFVSIWTDITERKRAAEAVLVERNRLRTLIDNIPGLVWLKDPDGVFLACNPGFERYFGVAENRVVGQRDEIFVSPELARRFRQDDQRAIALGQPITFEEWVETTGSEPNFLLETVKAPVYDHLGQVVGVFGIARDVTAERAAREQARLLTQAVEQSPESIMVAGLDHRIEYVNPSCVRTSGYSREELLGATPRLLHSGLTPAADYQALSKALAAGEVWRGRFHNRRKDGQTYIEAVIVSPIRNQAGEITRYLAIKEDITEQLAAADQLRVLAERMALATKAAGIGIWDWDLMADHLNWNDEMFHIYGLSRASFSGTMADWKERIDPDDLGQLQAMWHEYGNAAGELAEEFRITRPDGERRVIRSSFIIHRDPQGQPIRFVGTNLDVTDYRRAVEVATAAQEHAEAANLAKSRFLANMSHELRTPLNVIIGFSDLLLAAEADADRRDQLGVIHQTGRNLLQLIQDILDYSTIEAGRARLDEIDFSLLHEVHAVTMLFRPEAQRQGLAFQLEVDPSLIPPRLKGAVRLLRQVLTNLIGNALKFTPQGSVTVRLVPDGPALPGTQARFRFSVSDTGIGIRPENRQRIFEMFEQEDDTYSKRFGGSGLGLAICRRLVGLLGGEIAVDSTPGVGSCFSFTAAFAVLNAAGQAGQEQGAAGPGELAAAPTVRTLPSTTGRTVLIVEDDEGNRELLVRLVQSRAWQVSCAADGVQALALLERQPFDLILLDIQLPTLSGLEVARRIRAGTVAGCAAATPIVAVTAYALPADRERILSHGVDDYLSKPIDRGQLLSLLDRFAGAPATAAPPAVEAVADSEMLPAAALPVDAPGLPP